MVDTRSAAVLDKPAKGPGRGKLGWSRPARPTPAQKAWLRRGLGQPGGKLPLFDDTGQHYNPRTIKACIQQGWAEPWIENPTKPEWLVCKLTEAGRTAVS